MAGMFAGRNGGRRAAVPRARAPMIVHGPEERPMMGTTRSARAARAGRSRRRLTTVLAGAMAAAGVVAAAGMAAAGQAEVSLSGVVDLHAHAGPDSRPRSVNDLEAARLAQAAGMRAILLKNHFTMTADRAAIAMAEVDGIEIFGGVVLNRAVGGINPEAVRQMATFSGGRGKVVWLPTFDAEFYVTDAGGGTPFVSILENGDPVPAVLDVFDLIAEHDLTLAMGHSSPEEVLRLIPEAQDRGVERILMTHVFGQDATMDQMREMADAGAIMEIDWLAVYSGDLSVADYVAAINELGASAFVMSSDLGQAGNPPHPDGLRAYISAMREAGVSSEAIDLMIRRNPARLLGLDPW
ncbi:MAG: hypothetical protein F4061_15805 [Acidobacteria bacterium]|nr:hypothetical protein [Acidobacteriota bacterium]